MKPELKTIYEKLFGATAPAWWKGVTCEVPDLEMAIDGLLGRSASSKRALYFFSDHVKSSIDHRVDSIGIEEKVQGLDFGSLIDGTIHRGLVWVLGDPQGVGEGRGALGIHLVKPGAKPMTEELAMAMLRIHQAIRAFHVHIVFVNGETGERWPDSAEEHSPAPAWLSSIQEWTLPRTSPADLVEADGLTSLPLDRTLFGDRLRWTVSPKRSGVAYTEWTNHWQMLEVGLSLRAIGHRAVKVRYVDSSPLHLAGHGIEARVQKEMRDKLGVVLDWTGSVG